MIPSGKCALGCQAVIRGKNCNIFPNITLALIARRLLLPGNNIRSIYEAIIFLYAVHPFDVGDVLLLDGKDWCAATSLPCVLGMCAIHGAMSVLRYPGTKFGRCAAVGGQGLVSL